MALTALAPAFDRSKKALLDRSTGAILRLVPDLKPRPGEKATDRTFLTIIGAILVIGLLGLLGINILLGNDAVRIRELKLQSIAINEEREAILRDLDQTSSPTALAIRAAELGMVPSSSPTFIDLSVTSAEGNQDVNP
ncbi:MAG: hypothetical protein RLZZ251_38 [Actinomycetota bacterium]|jgi:hypothetical protein